MTAKEPGRIANSDKKRVFDYDLIHVIEKRHITFYGAVN